MTCGCGCGGTPVVLAKAKKRRSVDPTRTVGLRNDYEREFQKRWDRVAKAILREVGQRNELGLTTNRKFDFPTTQEKVAGFTSWLEDLINKALFGSDLSKDRDTATDRFWGNSFANLAYRRGLLGAVAQIRRAGGRVADSYIQSALSRGQHADTLKRLYTRAYDQLKEISRETSRQIGEVLAKGISEGKGPFEIAEMLVDRVQKIGLQRARLLARTEIISAFNEAELNSYQDAGIAGVELEPELLTAGDDRVCERCEAAAREKYTVETARGVIPIHPNCRCAWMPLIVNGKRINLE